MPLYEYQCQQCKETLEAIQRFSEDPYTICPTCGGELKKLISSPAIQFKGAGWYVNDYGKSGSKSPASASSSSDDGGGSKSSESKETKSSESKESKSSESKETKSPVTKASND